ncbi:MAG: hypothetical protein JZU55_18710 [Afipia sp.]|nr:hypothetical protein [Afipia sp.]
MSEKTRTPTGQAQFEKKQINAREGEKAMAQYDAEGRAVRLAREAAEAASAPVKAVKKAAAPKKKKAEAPAKLSDWLAEQQKGGFRT